MNLFIKKIKIILFLLRYNSKIILLKKIVIYKILF